MGKQGRGYYILIFSVVFFFFFSRAGVFIRDEEPVFGHVLIQPRACT